MSLLRSASRRDRGLDWVLITIYLSILLIGWLVLYSTVHVEGQTLSDIATNNAIARQSMWLGLSILVFIAVLNIDWKFWGSFSYIFYALTVISLILLFIIGKEVKGATSWFSLFGFSFQPSEFAKFTTCLALASYLSTANVRLNNRTQIMMAFAIFTVPAFLILLQPDAGTAIIFGSFLIVLYTAGFSPSFFIAVIGLAAVFLGTLLFGPKIILLLSILIISIILASMMKNPRYFLGPMLLFSLAAFVFSRFGYYNYILGLSVLLMFGLIGLNFIGQNSRSTLGIVIIAGLAIILSFGTDWGFNNLLKPHQQDRINVWLHPEKSDPRGSLYNILQSKTAIGSGGITGQGYLKGPMTQLDFVPEQNTDFIFSSLGEEQGFLGVIGFLALYSFMLYRILLISEKGKSKFIRYFGYGLFGLLFTHFFINIGMTLGIMPVIGIPLPFVSKGGSSILAFSIMLAVLLRMDRD